MTAAAERVAAAKAEYTPPQIHLIPFDQVKLSTDRRDLIKGIIPRTGITVVWGPPKCGKSFWAFDAMMHVALGWEYRGRRVHQGNVVYCIFEGQKGLEARVEAYRLGRLEGITEPVPLMFESVTLDLVRDHKALIKAIKETLANVAPAAVVLDTLNRSIRGSESSDEDMSAYVKAADAIREAFNCAVVIIHHCGVSGDRPRGHTSLTGAADAQLKISRDGAGRILMEVELSKDGPEGEVMLSELEVVVVGKDEDGDDITSCLVKAVEGAALTKPVRGQRLNENQEAMLRLLGEAGSSGLSTADWNAKAREIGIGVNRKATLHNLKGQLKDRHLVREYNDIWHVQR
jgi:hypothetical protein